MRRENLWNVCWGEQTGGVIGSEGTRWAVRCEQAATELGRGESATVQYERGLDVYITFPLPRSILNVRVCAVYSVLYSLSRPHLSLSFPDKIPRDACRQNEHKMHSPLPDSSVLEAGIIEDDRPSRLSRVQDNVRHLLRASIPTSFRSSVIAAPPAHRATVEDADRTPLQSPLRRHVRIDVGVLPSPSSATTSESTFADEGANVPGVLFPPTSYQQQAEHVNHQSTMFNTRAIAALTHPDLTDPSMAIFLQQKTQERQNRAWKRSKNRKLRYASSKRSMVSWLLCLVTALILAAVVAICEFGSARRSNAFADVI